MALVWISGGIGLLLLGIGIWSLLQWRFRMVHCTKRVEGIIENTSIQTVEGATDSYTATIAYEVDDRTYRMTEHFGTSFGSKGRVVSVWVDPDKPSRCRLDEDVIRSNLGISSPRYGKIFLVSGALCCVFALFMYFAPNLLYDLLHLPGDLLWRLKNR